METEANGIKRKVTRSEETGSGKTASPAAPLHRGSLADRKKPKGHGWAARGALGALGRIKMACTIRKARPEEAATLSTIAMKAKAHWGYAQEQLDMWEREFLTISSACISDHYVWVACIHSVVVGFSGVSIYDAEAELDHLWILPAYMGQGFGRRLFLSTATRIQEMGYPQMVFTSDPHADGFYRKLGTETIGEYYSVLQKTTLTKFTFPAVSQAESCA